MSKQFTLKIAGSPAWAGRKTRVQLQRVRHPLFFLFVFHSLLDNVEFRRVYPSDYRLFQIADLVCSLQLLELKTDNHELSKNEYIFFGDGRTLRKNYLKVLYSKQLQ